MKYRYAAWLAGFLLLQEPATRAQDSLYGKPLPLLEVIRIAVNNSVQLKIAGKTTELVRQQLEISKLYKLPQISSGLDYSYMSNADIWNTSFSNHQTGAIPHHYTQLTAQAGEIIFQGGEINNTIKKSSLQAQVALLSEEKNTEDIKFLIGAAYLDIFRFMNLRQVYLNNAKLAERRLKNIITMKNQGMVTGNDVLRTELTLSDLRLIIKKTNNTIAILNRQMNMVTGFPDSARLIPDSTLLAYQCPEKSLPAFIEEASQENHELHIAATEKKIAETDIKILGSDRYPQVSVFAGSALQRPFLYNIPSIDIYYNIWQAGIGIRYNISSIYQSPRKIKAGRIQLEQSTQKEIFQKQQTEVNIGSRFIKYNEARDELITLREDLKSAEENYRIVEKKYFSQLALLTDLIDATSIKLEAETKVTNAEIDTIYNYFLLLQSVGNFKL